MTKHFRGGKKLNYSVIVHCKIRTWSTVYTCRSDECIRIQWRYDNASKWEGYRPTKRCELTPPPFAKEPEPSSSTVPWETPKQNPKKHLSMEGINAARWNLSELKKIPTEKFRRWSEGKPEHKYSMQMSVQGETGISMVGQQMATLGENLQAKPTLSLFIYISAESMVNLPELL